MNSPSTVLCGGVSTPGEVSGKKVIVLDVAGPNPNVHLRISDLSRAMVRNVPDHLTDLLELAAYVFAADQAVKRGSSRDTGRQWRRRFQFHIPVRSLALWSRSDVTAALVDTLSFLSDDDYEFQFTELRRPQSVQLYLEMADNTLEADKVLLFSGGLDSLGGAVQTAIGEGQRVALVSHRSAPKRVPIVDGLVRDLKARTAKSPYHIPVWATKAESISSEYSMQRTRSFLYASLAAAVAQLLGLDRIEFYENGVTSVNLPIAPQAVGARASRTTHPQSLNGFARLFSLLFDTTFVVDNPFLWLTKAEVVQLIRDRGCADLVKHTVSCSRVVEATKLETHCGRCSQCIERRFATLAAGLTDQDDPSEMYKVQLMTDPRVVGETRTMAEAFLQRAQALATITELEFLKAYPEATRALRHVGLGAEEAARRIYDLHRRHGEEVRTALTEGHRENAAAFQAGSLPDSCVLVLAVPERYRERNAEDRVPTFRSSGDHWEIWFENERATVNDGVGPRHIASLLANPGQRIHAIDMLINEAIFLGKVDPISMKDGDDLTGIEVRRSPSGVGGLATDRLSARCYRTRLSDIEEELARARDPQRRLELEQESEVLLRHIRAVIGLGGKPRPGADDDERARQAVSKAVTRTINRLWKRHPPLARHLAKFLTKGEFFLYDPAPRMTWAVR